MKTYSIQDKYNDSKVWIVKVYCRGQVYYNQEISEIKVNSKFQPTTKAWINEILDINLNDIYSNEEQQEMLDSDEPEEYMGQDGTLHTYWEEQRKIDDDLYAVEKEIEDIIDTLPF